MNILKALILIVALIMSYPGRGQNITFDKQFKTADSLSAEGLPRQALGVYESIYEQAKAENNKKVLVRALVERSGSIYQIEEEPLVKLIRQLLSDVEDIDEPARQIVHSQIAELYWAYFSQNKWRILKRTKVDDVLEPDLRKWDVSALAGEMLSELDHSLVHAEKLQKTPVDDFSSLLQGDSTLRALRPTLYDQLVFRALNIIKNPMLGIDKPADVFHLNDEKYFSQAADFSSLNITSSDSLSLLYRSLKLYQDITAFRLTQSNMEALVDLELNRISYVSSNSQHRQKDSLTVSFFDQLISFPKYDDLKAKVMYHKALFLYEKRFSAEASYLNETVELCRKIIANYPNSEYMGLCRNMIRSIETPDLELNAEYQELPNKPFRVFVKWKNIDSVEFTMYKIYADQAVEYMNRYGFDRGELKHLSAFKTWEQKLPDITGYKKHSVEVPIDGVPKGFYLLVASYNNTADSVSIRRAAVMQITSLSLINRETPGKHLFVVGNAQTGRPVSHAAVELRIRKYNNILHKSEYQYFTTLKCNSDGEAVFEVVNKSINRIIASNGGDSLISCENIYINKAYKSTERVPEVVFYTDRAIYRPGQTIHFKGVVLRKDSAGYEVVKSHRETVELRDVNGQQLSSLDLVSNEYGTFSGSFILPGSGLNGTYSLYCQSGRTTFRVEAYRRPTFEVLFNHVKETYGFGDTVMLKGFVKSYSGSPINNVDVNYQIARSRAYPFRWPFRNDQQIIETGLAKTNADGSFVLSFCALSDNIDSKHQIYEYKVHVDASAPSGETQSNNYVLRISEENLFVDCNLDSVVTKNDFEGFNIRVTNLNGDNIEVRGVLSIYELVAPSKVLSERYWETPDAFLLDSVAYKKKFPYFPYKNEASPENWARGKKVFSKNIEIDGTGAVIADEWLNSESAYYHVEIKAETPGGEHRAAWNKTVRLIGEKPIAAEASSDWVTVLKKSGESGEVAEIWLSALNTKSPIRFELVKGKELLRSEIITPDKRVYRLLIPIEEAYRGDVVAQFTQVANNREYYRTVTIEVPQNDHKLDVSLKTFRDRLLPGEQETWSLSIEDNSGSGVVAEMLATMYDASLDKFKKHNWRTNFFNKRTNNSYRWGTKSYGRFAHSLSYTYYKNRYPTVFVNKNYEELALFKPNAYAVYGSTGGALIRGAASVEKSVVPITTGAILPSGRVPESDDFASVAEVPDGDQQAETEDFSNVEVRDNFNETAFFYPHLYSDKDGKLEFSFTMPDAITRWKFMGFAHTQDFKFGSVETELVSRKNVSVEAYAPRFLRQGDTITFSATVRNLTDENLSGSALLQFGDALTFDVLTSAMLEDDSVQNFEIKAQSDEVVRWKVLVPDGLQAVTYKVMARADKHSDGEQKILPVLNNRKLVTESMPFVVRGGDERTFYFEKMKTCNSSTLKNYSLTVEYTSNPLWYAIQALPYLMECSYECSEQIFSRFYANAAASALMNSSPRIKAVFDAWKEVDADAFLSNLEKNSELKSVLLEETPWLLQAQNESEMKKRLALLFDLNRMSMEFNADFVKLQQMQLPDGSFPWFTDMPGNRYITQHIVRGMSELQKNAALPLVLNEKWMQMRDKAMNYLDKCVAADYKKRLTQNKNNSDFVADYMPSRLELHYLYTHSFDVSKLPSKSEREAFDFLLNQAEKQWLKYGAYAQGMLALIFHRFDNDVMAERIIKSLSDRALRSEGDGMYWANNKGGYRWYQSPVETQALLINVFDEVAHDEQSVEELKIWLLRNKQSNHWGNTKATVAACNSLLYSGSSSLSQDSLIELELAGKPLSQLRDLKAEAGTGYVKTAFAASEIEPEMAQLKVENPNKSVAWGAVYWQYFEQLDKITSAETDVVVDKQLFVKQRSDEGETLLPIDKHVLKIGDEVVVRIVIETARDMEYVHLKDMRAAGLEPTTTLSGYAWHDGLGFYRETKDAATNFFIARLRKGVYVFEYSLRAAQVGQFSNGITTLQCMYAPEYTTHSEGKRILIK